MYKTTYVMIALFSATSLFGAAHQPVGRTFITLEQLVYIGEKREDYLRRIQPFLPTPREFSLGTLIEHFIRYRKEDKTIQIARKDIDDAKNLLQDKTEPTDEQKNTPFTKMLKIAINMQMEGIEP